MGTILVTGAAGELGRDAGPWLARQRDVRLTDLQPMETSLEFVQGDLCDPAFAKRVVAGVDAVVHLAVLLPCDRPWGAFVDANVKAPAVLLEAAAEAGVRRFVYASTVWTTGHGPEEGEFLITEQTHPTPLESYGVTKLMGEYAAEYSGRMGGLSALALRLVGYKRIDGFTDQGEPIPGEVDVPAVAKRLCSPGYKLFDPGNLGRMLLAAVDAPVDGFHRMLISPRFPYTRDDAPLLRTDPVAVIDRYCPGMRDLLARHAVTVPPVPYVYDTTRAEQAIGWVHSYGLDDVLRWDRDGC